MSVASGSVLVSLVADAGQAACNAGQEVLVRADACDVHTIAASDR